MRKSWDEYFMDLARLVATRSKDTSTKVGAVIVGPNREIRSTGYNGFPRQVNDDIPARHERPMKYYYTVHSEQNAIFNACRAGTSVDGCTIYIAGRPPCSWCARAIIQSGIRRVVVDTMESAPKPGVDYALETQITLEMFKETNTELCVLTTPDSDHLITGSNTPKCYDENEQRDCIGPFACSARQD